MEKIRVVLADDHATVRRGLSKMLNQSSQVEVVGEAGNGREALELTNNLNPDVLLLDVEMPGMKGFEVAKQLKDSDNQVRVLALSGYNEMQYVLGMLANGAAGYLTKDEAPRQLMNAIKEIAGGRRGWISPGVAEMLGVPARPTGTDQFQALTKIEKQILQKIAAAKADTDIGKELGIEKTVLGDHIKKIFQKLEVKTRVEALLRAIQEDLL
jgi:DNA-binding NarL/FixJ family response regulator